ncbi:MAG: glycosyltransferase [Promethearchaeota archaeon]
MSIIIITLNEIEELEKTITAVRQATQINSKYVIPVEIIISDGSSNDGTIEVAKKLADKVVIGPPNRYKQLNKGAEISKGDILLFLHADTILPKNGIVEIMHELKDLKIIGGAFKKKWNWNPKVARSSFLRFTNFLWQALGNWLVRFFKLFPGDNAIFVRKNVFKQLSGFSPLWICEDFDFTRRLRKFGRRYIKCLPLAVHTSTRRFEKYGFIRVIFIWFFIYCLWRLGMSADRLRVRFNKYSTVPERGNKKYMRF